ncbi:hypothetical protein P9B03_14145 [Metasolibacillus meyeri]|uniref:Uncharacterized protein n=1 Tax=Metasolibacillus meyeri TaxID=1071052 RepID=A0AAW9NTH8_9BACL|nr:hypothetical protein [Metasolibacillus meyeri]MEC1179637.1 hypothetical protein [Metasolibacillus meyeri]
MKKFKKALTTIAVTGLLLSSLGTLTKAATYESYSYVVPIFEDSVTSLIKKETTGSAYNKVSTIQKDRTLVSWVENTSGTNITSKVTYSSTGTKTMDYKASASEYKGKNVQMSISTSPGTFEKTSTTGEWTPN